MKQRYRWLQARLWLGLIVFWLVSMILATLMTREFGRRGEPYIILVMLIMVGVCVFTPRAPRPLWKALLAFPVALAAHAVLQLIGVLPALLGLVDSKEKLDRVVAFSGALPVVIYSMRQSRLFVATQAEPEAPVEGRA